MRAVFSADWRRTGGRWWGPPFSIPRRCINVDKLRLGIPKGSLEKATIDLFRRAGWNIKGNGRSYFPEIDDPEISCTMCRAQEMSRYVENGTLDCGLTGKDWIMENDSQVVVVADLMYSKTSSRPVRWVLAVPGDSNIRSLADMANKKIATELVNYTRRYFESRNIPVTVEFSWGATEAKVAQGLADAVVEVTETGSTIKAHGLKIVHEFFQSNTQFIVNPDVWESKPFKREKIENIRMLLLGALRAENMVGLKMNIQEKSLKTIIALLPSLLAPTISSLYETDWYSVEVVVNQEEVRSLVPRLVSAGAQGIVEYPLYKVI
uniref:ATP phosphoribosyltransferase n=1 Tax=Desulfobacca acetoxidans TaxID=60893 RepID=A0A7V6A1D5_9BACT